MYAYQQCSPNLQIDDSRFERLDPKGSPPPGRKSHPFVSYLQKARKHLCRNGRIREKQMEVLEMAERESRNWFVFGKIRESEMCVSDCIQKINVSGQAFCSWCHEVRTSKSKFCLFFCFKFHHHHLGFVPPLQDVALHQCLPSSSVCCLPNPGGSLLLCYVILPSSAWSSSRPLPSPWLPLCASPCPPIVL